MRWPATESPSGVGSHITATSAATASNSPSSIAASPAAPEREFLGARVSPASMAVIEFLLQRCSEGNEPSEFRGS